MRSIELLDAWISQTVRSWSTRLSGESRSPELLEIRRELLTDMRNQIQPVGNGRFLFPYRTVNVHLATVNDGQREALDAAFGDGDELKRDFCSLLSEAGCPVPEGFAVNVAVVEEPALAFKARPFRTEYSNAKPHSPVPVEITRRAAKLTVLRGTADVGECLIEADRIYLGRLKEVVSETGSLRRRNDVAFSEDETTVSREHASITYDHETGAYRLHDSRSQRGTSVFRDSRELRVPKGSTRGLDLRSGDEIHLGEARILFELV